MAKYSSRSVKQKKGHPVLRKILQTFAFITASALAIVAGLGFAVYKDVDENVQSEEYTQFLNAERQAELVDPIAGRAVNYLLIGSDDRSGENSDLGGGNAEDGQRSDTTIIAHVSKDRTRIDLVSIPRDSIVDIPSCKLSNGGSTQSIQNGQFNWAFSMGDNLPSSIACTISTIEENTEMFIDGYAVVDFAGFEDLVNSVGGIPFDVPEDMVSVKADLDLKKGQQVLDGEDALAYARARTFEIGESNGSDLDRIERQQELLKALASQILSSDTLSDPKKIYDTTESALNSVTVSPELGSAAKLGSFAYSLRNVSESNINFYTIPNATWSQDANRVIWTDEADEYWNNLMNDVPIEEENPETVGESNSMKESSENNG